MTKHAKRLAPLAMLTLVAACSSSSNYKYVPVQEPLPTGKQSGLSSDEAAVEATLQTIAATPIAGAYFGKMFGSALLVLKDFDDLTFTVTIKDGRATLSRGTDAKITPEFIIPMRRRNVDNLLKIVEDGTIDDEEAYRIHGVTYVAGLRSIFRQPALYNEDVAKRLALPAFMQMSLKNGPAPALASATVVNVKGQWLVFEGLLGDPDVKLEVSHAQANNLIALIYKPLPNETSAAVERIDAVKKLLDASTVYRRAP